MIAANSLVANSGADEAELDEEDVFEDMPCTPPLQTASTSLDETMKAKE